MTSSDASEDEDNLDELRQAVDGALFTDSLFGGAPVVQQARPERSLRPDRREEVGDGPRVTDEFRRFVAVRLGKLLDDRIRFVSDEQCGEAPERPSRVRLLSESVGFIEDDEEVVLRPRRRKTKSRKVSLSEVAVTGEDVLSGKGAELYSSGRRPRVYRYELLDGGDDGRSVLIESPRTE